MRTEIKRHRGRPSSDLKLREGDAAKPRRRRDRKKPPPDPRMVARKQESRAFADSLPMMPSVIAERRGDTWEVQSPHKDDDLWRLQLVEAFGTRSGELIMTFVEQLARLCPDVWDEALMRVKVDEAEWNALIAMVADHRPKTSAQAALAAQMAAIHLLTMRLSAQALNQDCSVNLADAALTAKLAKTFAAQCEAMMALQGKVKTAKQSIHVTRDTSHHVHYHDHRGDGENGNQPHEPRAKTTEQGSKMPSQMQIDG